MLKTYQKEDYVFQNGNDETYISTPELSSTPLLIGGTLFAMFPSLIVLFYGIFCA